MTDSIPDISELYEIPWEQAHAMWQVGHREFYYWSEIRAGCIQPAAILVENSDHNYKHLKYYVRKSHE